MLQTILDYYQTELEALYEQALYFAKAHPQYASQLGILPFAIKNPELERLLQGTAFLTARIQKKIDGDFKQISHVLLTAIMPALLQHSPAAGIACYQPNSDPSDNFILEKSTPFHATTTTGDTVIFTNPQPVHISKAKIKSTLYKRTTHGAELVIKLSCVDNNTLNFYLNTNNQSAHAVITALLQSRISTTHQPQEPHLQLYALAAQNCWLAQPANLLFIYQIIREFFHYPLKRQFFSLTNLCVYNEAVDITFYFKKFDTQFERLIHTNLLQLNCFPLINQYSTTCEPIKLNHDVAQQTIQLDNIIAIENVTAYKNDGEMINVAPLLENPSSATELCYYAHYNTELNKTQLSFNSSQDYAQIDLLEVQALKSNQEAIETILNDSANLAAHDETQLDSAVLCWQSQLYPGSFNQINQQHYWQLIALLNQPLQYAPAHADAVLSQLKLLLRALHPASASKFSGLIDDLSQLSIKLITGRSRTAGFSAVTYGYEFNLLVDTDDGNKSELSLLGLLLFHYLQATVEMNRFVILILRNKQHQVLHQWQ